MRAPHRLACDSAGQGGTGPHSECRGSGRSEYCIIPPQTGAGEPETVPRNAVPDGRVPGSHQGHSGTANWGSQGAYLSSSLELDGRERADVTEGTERSEGAVLERAALTGMPTERLMARQRGQED